MTYTELPPVEPTGSELPLLDHAERNRLLVEWNDNRTDYPRNLCVHELFEQCAREQPGALAVVFGQERLTYRQLNRRANQLAHYLRSHGVVPGMRVGICLERSLEMVIGILGVLKAGCAYAPLDPTLPQERLRQLLNDLQMPVVLTQPRWLEMIGACPDPTFNQPLRLCLDVDWKALAGAGTGNLCVESDAEDTAYISFTSGSTGRPKGVCIPHRGIVRLVRQTNWMKVFPQDVFLQLAPTAFDASLLEIWGSLANGARLVVAPPQLLSLSELAALIQRERVTVAWFTTGLFNQVVEEIPHALVAIRLVLTGGDTASPVHFKKALQSMGVGELFNCYGPTENSTFSTVYKVTANFDVSRPVPIGRPIANTQCYILDEHLEPVAIGIAGELFVGGDGVACGYLNNPQLTRERFIPNPHEPGTRLYRTGDLARYLPDGNIEFLGRRDLQVKIRGFRVELAEVEAALNQHPNVQQCAVKAWPDSSGSKQLAAYIVPAPGSMAAKQDWAGFLRSRLPDFMVPRSFVILRQLPFSNTGKVDRKALPKPVLPSFSVGGSATVADEVQRKVLEVWETTLETRPIKPMDNFFSLGGHSLLALRLAARLEKIFRRRIPVARIFENPTIQELSALLRQKDSQSAGSALVAIQSEGQLPPLYLVHGAGGGMFWGYSNLARHLGPNQPVFAFKSRGLDGMEELESIEELAEAYIVELRTIQSHGPYRLGGYCFGGLVAYEMARQLEAQGQKIVFLALINADAPNSSYCRCHVGPEWALKFVGNVCAKAYYSLPRSAGQWRAFMAWRFRRAARRIGSLAGFLPPQDPERWLNLSGYSEDQRRLWQTHVDALNKYRPLTYSGRLTLFRSPFHQLSCSFDPGYGWGDFVTGGVHVRTIPAAHDRIMEEPQVARLACVLKQELCAANQE